MALFKPIQHLNVYLGQIKLTKLCVYVAEIRYAMNNSLFDKNENTNIGDVQNGRHFKYKEDCGDHLVGICRPTLFI